MTTIVLADDHHIVRQGVRALLDANPDMQVVGEVERGDRVLAEIERLRPDVLVLDLQMPGFNGIDVLQHLQQAPYRPAVIIFSMHDNESYVFDTIRLGAEAYVLKSAAATELLHAIRAVQAGERYLSPPLQESAIEEYLEAAGGTDADRFEALTRREREILGLIAEGHTNAVIGEKLELSRRTVESHRANLMRKLEMDSQAALIRFYIERTQLSADAN
jgi:two-component system, NarL family, response regulator NreC